MNLISGATKFFIVCNLPISLSLAFIAVRYSPYTTINDEGAMWAVVLLMLIAITTAPFLIVAAWLVPTVLRLLGIPKIAPAKSLLVKRAYLGAFLLFLRLVTLPDKPWLKARYDWHEIGNAYLSISSMGAVALATTFSFLALKQKFVDTDAPDNILLFSVCGFNVFLALMCWF